MDGKGLDIMVNIKDLFDIIVYMCVIYMGVHLPSIFRKATSAILMSGSQEILRSSSESLLYTAIGSLLIAAMILLVKLFYQTRYFLIKYIIAFGLFVMLPLYIDFRYIIFNDNIYKLMPIKIFQFTMTILIIFTIMDIIQLSSKVKLFILTILAILAFAYLIFFLNSTQKEYSQNEQLQRQEVHHGESMRHFDEAEYYF